MNQHLQILQEDAQECYERFACLHQGLLARANEIMHYALRLYPEDKYLEYVEFLRDAFVINYIMLSTGVSIQFPKFPSVQRKKIQLPADLLYRDDWKRRYNDWEVEHLTRGSNVLEEKSVS